VRGRRGRGGGGKGCAGPAARDGRCGSEEKDFEEGGQALVAVVAMQWRAPWWQEGHEDGSCVLMVGLCRWQLYDGSGMLKMVTIGWW
jgi:hypothetical protein